MFCPCMLPSGFALSLSFFHALLLSSHMLSYNWEHLLLPRQRCGTASAPRTRQTHRRRHTHVRIIIPEWTDFCVASNWEEKSNSWVLTAVLCIDKMHGSQRGWIPPNPRWSFLIPSQVLFWFELFDDLGFARLPFCISLLHAHEQHLSE